MNALATIYYIFYSEKKERVEMVLEPLQAMTQLAIMTHCPIGSKFSISNNLLCIQTPSWSQSVTRSFNHDKKDDLYFLFNVINRYYTFYVHLKNKKGKISELFDLIIDMSISGLDKIINTYSRSNGDYTHLLQTLKMYRKILENPSLFTGSIDNNENASIVCNTEEKEKDVHDKKNSNNKKNSNSQQQLQSQLSNTLNTHNVSSDKNIDTIFIKITNLYSDEHLHIIYNTLKLIQKFPEDCILYMNGLNNINTPLHNEIKKWIHENIVF